MSSLKLPEIKPLLFPPVCVLFACVGVQRHATEPQHCTQILIFFFDFFFLFVLFRASNTEAFRGLNLQQSIGGCLNQAGKPTKYLIHNEHISCEELSMDLAIFLRASAYLLTQTKLGEAVLQLCVCSAPVCEC